MTVTVTVDFPTGPEPRHLHAGADAAEGQVLSYPAYLKLRQAEVLRVELDRARRARREHRRIEVPYLDRLPASGLWRGVAFGAAIYALAAATVLAVLR